MKLGYINGLRGFAILMVIWHHWYSRSVSVHTPEFLDPLVNTGHFGVEIFFVLSGFVLYFPYQNGREFRAREYLIRRAKRLLPLFYAVLFASAALRWKNPLPFVLLLFPNPDVIGPEFNFPLWSISAEIWFSALFPVLIFLMRWSWAPYLLIAASLGCVAGPPWIQDSLPGKLYLFLIGMLVAANLKKAKGTIWCLPLGIAAAYLPGYIGGPVAGVAAAGLILYCWNNRENPVTRLLEHGVLQIFGIMCFSIYVWHEPVRVVTSGFNAFSPIQFANWALLAGVSVLSFRFIEFGAVRNWRQVFQMPTNSSMVSRKELNATGSPITDILPP